MNALEKPNRTTSWREALQQLATREYCTWASPYLAWLRQPLGILLLSGVAALLCGLVVARQGFVVFAAVVAVMAIGCIWPWIGIRGVACRLRFAAARSEEGKPVELELALTNRWPLPIYGLAVEGGFSLGDDSPGMPSVAIARIGGWSRGYVSWKFVPELRGRYPIATPYLVTEFPFGLWKAKRPIEIDTKLIVWPERFPLPPLVLPSGRQSWAGQPSECATGSLGHRTTVREYRRGDSLRQIHWAKTARYEKLISCAREGLAITEAIISLDTDPALHAGSGRDSSVEWTIRIAASICDALLRQGVGVTVAAHGGRMRAQSMGSSRVELLDWLAGLNTSPNSKLGSIVPSRTGPGTSTLTIHITTDLADNCAGDSIVFQTKPSVHDKHVPRRTLPSWMTVAGGADIPSQVRNGWRNGPRSVRHAV